MNALRLPILPDIYVDHGITKSGGHGAPGTKPGRPLPGRRLIAIVEIEDDDDESELRNDLEAVEHKKVAPQSRRKGLLVMVFLMSPKKCSYWPPGRGRDNLVWPWRFD